MACIDYVSGFSHQRAYNQSCKNKTNEILKKEVIYLENFSDLFSTALQKVGKKKSGTLTINDKLFVLNDVSCRHNNEWSKFEQRFNNSLYKPVFLVATTRNRDELEGLPQRWRAMFEEVNMTPPKPKGRISNFASKEDIDEILGKHIRRYPYKSRAFVVGKAMSIINH